MPARLLVLYCDLDPRVRASVERFAPAAGLTPEYVDTSASQQAYADELAARWGRGDDLIVVEQDKEVHGQCFPEMLACPQPWCGYTYWIFPQPHTTMAIGGFGVTKFGVAAQAMAPVSVFRGEGQFAIDRRFYEHMMAAYGTGCCLHGHVIHHHVYEPRSAALRWHVDQLRAKGLAAPTAAPAAAGPHLLPGSYDLNG